MNNIKFIRSILSMLGIFLIITSLLWSKESTNSILTWKWDDIIILCFSIQVSVLSIWCWFDWHRRIIVRSFYKLCSTLYDASCWYHIWEVCLSLKIKLVHILCIYFGIFDVCCVIKPKQLFSFYPRSLHFVNCFFLFLRNIQLIFQLLCKMLLWL